MYRKSSVLFSVLLLMSMVLSACAQQPTPAAEQPVRTVVVTEIVEVAGTAAGRGGGEEGGGVWGWWG